MSQTTPTAEPTGPISLIAQFLDEEGIKYKWIPNQAYRNHIDTGYISILTLDYYISKYSASYYGTKIAFNLWFDPKTPNRLKTNNIGPIDLCNPESLPYLIKEIKNFTENGLPGYQKANDSTRTN